LTFIDLKGSVRQASAERTLRKALRFEVPKSEERFRRRRARRIEHWKLVELIPNPKNHRHQTVANYQQAALSAFQQVEDNLSTLRILSEQAKAQRGG
jgi:hypothetical protein